eukprot:4212447-Amphidinium_carterae.2
MRGRTGVSVRHVRVKRPGATYAMCTEFVCNQVSTCPIAVCVVRRHSSWHARNLITATPIALYAAPLIRRRAACT